MQDWSVIKYDNVAHLRPSASPVWVSVGATISITYNALASSTTDLTEYTFSAVALGDEAANRKIVVTILGRSTNPSTRTISSVTVAGVAATEAVSVSNTIGNRAAIYVADVPTGTTGDIVVTFDLGMQNCSVGSYAMYGAGSSTPTDTATDIASAFSQTLDVPAGGAAFAVAGVQANTTTTWAGLTERYDTAVDAECNTGAGVAFAAAQSGLTVSATFGAGTDGAMVTAAFGP